MRIKTSRSDIRVAPIYKPQTRPINPAGIESSGEPVNAWLTKHPPSVTYDVDLGTHALDPRSKRR